MPQERPGRDLPDKIGSGDGSMSSAKPIHRKRLPGDPELQEAVLAGARELYAPGNDFGVYGFGIGSKLARGRKIGYKSLRVFVPQKTKDPATEIKPVHVVWKGKDLFFLPDIVAKGYPYVNNALRPIKFSGLHPGAPIVVDYQYGGGVACILTKDDSRPTHLLTSGHLFQAPGNDGKLPEVEVAAEWEVSNDPFPIGYLEANLLDSYPSNPGHSIDAALVCLNNDGVDMAKEPFEGPTLREPLSSDAAKNTSAQVYLPTTNDYSGRVRIEEAFIEKAVFYSDVRDEFIVEKVLQTETSVTVQGDSGTILFQEKPDGNDEYGGIGICVGGRIGVFEPLDRALEALNRQLPYNVTLWRKSR